MHHSNTHIIISNTDFLGVHIYKPIEVHMRSLEKYLEKNKRDFLFEGSICTVQVYDKQDAIRIGMENKLKQIIYVDGQTRTTVSLIGKTPSTKRTTMLVLDSNGVKTSLRKIKQQPHLEAKKSSLTKSDIIKRGILTKRELDNAITSSQLTVTVIERNSYIDRKELQLFLSKKK